MAIKSKRVRFKKQMAKLEAHKKAPDKVKLLPREAIRIRLRCRLCGCFTNVKARLDHEECPIGKWPV